MDKTQELFMGVGLQLPDLLNNLGFDTKLYTGAITLSRGEYAAV